MGVEINKGSKMVLSDLNNANLHNIFVDRRPTLFQYGYEVTRDNEKVMCPKCGSLAKYRFISDMKNFHQDFVSLGCTKCWWSVGFHKGDK